MKVLVTGVAGFIGMHCAQRLLERGDTVVGIDNLSTYYSVQLKKDRLARLKNPRFEFHQVDIADAPQLESIVEQTKPDAVLHLAARQAFEQGRSAGVLHLLFSPVVRFIKFYLMRLGFLDGLPGLLHISIGCMNSYVKYMKLIELRRAENR